MSERSEQPVIDIDEFERRLRSPAPRPAGDPLAELARLVKGDGQKPQALDAMFTPREPSQAAGRGDVGYPHGVASAPAGDYAVSPVYAAAPVEDATAETWSGADEFGASAMEARPRSKRLLYAAAGVIVLGLGGVSTFALKARTGPEGLVEVKAAPGPVKVQAQAAPGQSAPSEASVLERGASAPTVNRVVERQEQPVNLTDAAKAARAENSVSVPPLPIARENVGQPAFGEPRKVKTVSVRPDGTVVGAQTATAQPSSPAAGQAGKSDTTKPVARVGATPKADTADKDQATKTPAPKPVAAKPEPVKVARATQADAGEDDRTTPTGTTRAGRGDFAVQLAAPTTEAEARAAAVRLTRQYGTQLGGARLTFKKASDKEVYRVRAAGLSQEDASAACDKVKAAGGSCFVVRN